jgi:hypothetical protein
MKWRQPGIEIIYPRVDDGIFSYRYWFWRSHGISKDSDSFASLWSGLRNLSKFPADVQKLQLIYRMWDNDPDDRCRYFWQLHYADNTAWQLCIKRHPKCVSFKLLAPKAEIDVYETS